MARLPQDDSLLTPEQRKRELANERNRKSRALKKIASSSSAVSKTTLNDDGLSSPLSTPNCPLSITETQQPLPITESSSFIAGSMDTLVSPYPSSVSQPYQRIATPYRNRIETLVTVSLSVSITVLLCYFQSRVYVSEGDSEPLSWAVATICEVCLCILSMRLTVSFDRILFYFLFSYNLATMSFGLLKIKSVNLADVSEAKLKKNALEKTETRKQKALQELFDSTRLAFDRATDRGQIKNSQNLLKVMQETGEKLGEKEVPPAIKEIKKEASVDPDLIVYKAVGLIVLRAILMLINALFIHRIFSRDYAASSSSAPHLQQK